MRFFDIYGNELEDKDAVDYDSGRYLQDANEPDKYVFSPWDTVPAREEESAPDISTPTNAELADALIELAEAILGEE